MHSLIVSLGATWMDEIRKKLIRGTSDDKFSEERLRWFKVVQNQQKVKHTITHNG